MCWPPSASSVCLSLTWIPAILANGITAALAPVVVALLGSTARRPTAVAWRYALALLGVGLGLAVRMRSAGTFVTGTGRGLALAAVTGVSVVLLATVSRWHGRLGVTTTQVMAACSHLTPASQPTR
jgi:hypothetical protein